MQRDEYLSAMGIEVFRLRSAEGPEEVESAPAQRQAAGPERSQAAGRSRAPQPTSAVPAAATEQSVRAGDDPRQLNWDELAATVSSCSKCALHGTRTQAVFGVGARQADLLVIGEAPGADEDRQGEPFVGRAGQLLNAMLRAIGFDRKDVYIANILKCRPPGNRDPKPEEIAMCTPYLERQIELIAPRAVLAVGRIAAQHLLQSDQPVGRLRGKLASFGAPPIPIVVTYHPAYLLRSPQAKAKAWDDLCLVKGLLSDSR